MVIGEYERAFYGNQFAQIAPTLRRYNVQLWMPEVDGPVDFSDPDHQALMQRLGVRAKHEVWRARARVIAAMQEQAREQGRFLGGRPPYGYRLADAGPHPNKAHALWGRRLQRLEPDPDTARHVEWIFAQRLAGHSAASIVRDLNAKGVPCPSEADPDRNPHRSCDGWQLRTVASILANPRYTGRQVWNRQYTDHNPDDPKNQVRGAKDVMRWNPPDLWVISNELAHAVLVSEPDFVAAQKVHVSPLPQDGTTRIYALSGLIRCGICGRKFDSHWVNNRPGYRCRHGHNSSRQLASDRVKMIYIREDEALAQLGRLGQVHSLGCAGEVANLVRSHRWLLVCDFSGLRLDAAA